MFRVVLVLLVVAWSTAAWGIEPTRIEKLGKPCPAGYTADGGYCIPGPGAEFAFHKQGRACPGGYSARGGYCVVAAHTAELAILRVGYDCPPNYRASGMYCFAKDNAKAAMPRDFSCPRGWRSSGRYCISRQ